jgi:hypothetical protein
MNKITLTDALLSTTMFLVDQNNEDKIEAQICSDISQYKKKMHGIDSISGLEKFIRSERESINMIETLLGISGEKMKRVVSMLRLMRGYTFDSEWSEERIQSELSANKDMMCEFCNLLLEGYKTPKYKDLIPHFILQDFRIDKNKLSRLSNDDFMRSLLRARFVASYSALYSHIYDDLMKNAIEPIASIRGLSYKETVLREISTTPCHVITDEEKYIIVNYSFQSTTGNYQNKYAENHVAATYRLSRDNSNMIVVNLLDGAGWIGRAQAFKMIYHDCDYFLNLKNIHQIENIITDFFNLK